MARGVVGLIAAPVLVYQSCAFVTGRDDAAYAGWVFDGVIPYAEVLASRYWTPLGDRSGWGCTFAVVRLGPNAPVIPGEGSGDRARTDFGGNWRQGPLPPPGEMTRDALEECRSVLPPAAAAAVAAAAADPVLWWIRDDPVGETVQLYSVAAGVAARIRLGD